MRDVTPKVSVHLGMLLSLLRPLGSIWLSRGREQRENPGHDSPCDSGKFQFNTKMKIL